MTATKPLRRDTPRPLRRDAAENREKVLAAAAHVFGQQGIEGSVEEVARRAGVGMGTLYRRFPTKQALIDELVGEGRLKLRRLAQLAAERTDGTGLEELLWNASEFQADQLGCLDRLWDQSDAELEAIQEFRTIMASLLATAQEFGQIRPDVTRADLTAVFWALRGVIESTRGIAPLAWRRHLELIMAGLRPVADTAFSSTLRNPAMSDAETQRVIRAQR